MGKHVFLIDNEISRIAQIECLIAGTQITFSTAHNERTASPMLYSEEIDLVAMSGSVSGSAPLLNKLLDLKNAKGTLLLLYPILNREARTEFYRRGFDMCVASEDPAECAAAISVKMCIRDRGYTARPEYSVEDRVFYGTILGIDDMVDFQSESAKDLEEQFHKAVDDYLKFCAEIGKEPQKKYSGLFNVRIPPELHRELSLLAQAEGISLNKAVEQAIRTMVQS